MRRRRWWRRGAVTWSATTALCASISLYAAGAHAFRTLADDPTIDTTDLVTWTSRSTTIDLATGPLSAAQSSFVEHQIRGAFVVWQEPACSTFRFSYGGARSGRAHPGDGLNTVEWVGDGWAERGFETGVAATSDIQLVSVDGGGWAIREADIYLNGDEASWHGIDPDGVDLRAVLIHELGHALGLMHPCELGGTAGAPACELDGARYRASVLFPIHAENGRTLSADDLLGLCTLYGATDCGECADGLVCIDGACRNPVDVLACGRDGVDACSACAADADCASGRYCEDGACAERLGVGARCSADRECDTGMCPEGVCTTPCESPSDCRAESSCSADGWCRLDQFARSPCSAAEDCSTSFCLTASAGTASCTNACRSDGECLLGETCGRADGVSVCTPGPTSGCSVTGGVSAGVDGRFVVWMSVVICWFALFRRKRVRR